MTDEIITDATKPIAERIGRDELYLLMALLVSKRSTCSRRDVGCILVNERGHVLATGYNGVPSGLDHCKGIDGVKCPGADAESGKDLDRCLATHAEVNALLQCRDVWEVDTAYVTAFPCGACLKQLRNSSCKRIIYIGEYLSPDVSTLWDGREIIRVTPRSLWELLDPEL